MEKVAVLPVPDWACAMTSDPVCFRQSVVIQGEECEGCTFDYWHDSPLLDSRWPFETISVDT